MVFKRPNSAGKKAQTADYRHRWCCGAPSAAKSRTAPKGACVPLRYGAVHRPAQNALIICRIRKRSKSLHKFASSLSSLVYLYKQNAAQSHIDYLHAPSRTYR